MQNRKLCYLLFRLVIIFSFLIVQNSTFAVSDDIFTEEELAYFEELRRMGEPEEDIESLKKVIREDRVREDKANKAMLKELKENLEELRRKGASEEEIESIEAFIREDRENSRELTDSEKIEIDQYLKLIWKQMCTALSKGDVEKALTFFEDRRESQYRKIFERMSKEELKEMSKDLMANDMELDSFYGSNGVHYNLIIGKYSYSIQFVKPYNDDWKIEFF